MTSFAMGLAEYKRFDLQLLLHFMPPLPLCVCFAKFTYRLAEGLHNEGHSLMLLLLHALWQMANHHSIANGNGKSLSTERIL